MSNVQSKIKGENCKSIKIFMKSFFIPLILPSLCSVQVSGRLHLWELSGLCCGLTAGVLPTQTPVSAAASPSFHSLHSSCLPAPLRPLSSQIRSDWPDGDNYNKSQCQWECSRAAVYKIKVNIYYFLVCALQLQSHTQQQLCLICASFSD